MTLKKENRKKIKAAKKKQYENLNKGNPVHQKDQLEGEETSPFDAPDAYAIPTNVEQISYEQMPPLLQRYIDEHEKIRKELADFEEALLSFKKQQWVINEEVNEAFSHFFNIMDNQILQHHRDEEKELFPVLHDRLIEEGEHSQMTKEGKYRTAVDIMEDDHINFIQLSSLILNFLGLSSQLPGQNSQSMVADLAFEQGRTLIEQMKLHMHKEETTVFPLACQVIQDKTFEVIQHSPSTGN